MAHLERVSVRHVGRRLDERAAPQPLVVPRATASPSRAFRGSSAMNPSSRSASKRYVPGSCQRNGPVFAPNASTPLAKKLPSDDSTLRSFRLCVRKRTPFTANRKSSGTSDAHRAKTAGDLRL